MRVPMVSAAFLLVFITLLAKTSGEDLYLEGEDDSANEFLEVNDDSGFGASLHRLKRHLTTSVNRLIRAVTSTTPQYDYNTEDPDVGEDDDPDDFDIDSGTISSLDLEPKEKTVRVTFVVMEPYQLNYSNRDSPEFQNISLSLAAAVDDLFRDLPGTQRTSLVRIQSRPTDEFSCKVTLDISSIGFENTKALTSLLRDQIRTTGKLGPVTVSDADFSENINDAGYNSPLYTCATDEIQCNSNKICLPASMRCDKNRDCEDGTDELDCPPDYTEDIEQEVESPATAPPCVPWTCPLSYYTICESQKCDGNSDCPDNEDENDCPEIETTPDYVETTPEPENTTPLPSQQSPYFTTTPGAPQGPLCEANDWKCDETRCVPESSRCDGRRDCNDGTDEADCPKSCGADDFTCRDGKCIEGWRRCDRVVDCLYREDEEGCECRANEFRCITDDACIEIRKRCDGVKHCSDGSDELDCGCKSNQWQCDHGNCIQMSKRCDGRVDCPTDRSDERNCLAGGYFKCRMGKLIPEYQRCDRRYDCGRGDYSDEQNCPCGDGDFKCDNGYCIPASKYCDRTRNCQDGSDERDCTYGTVCMAYQYKCSSGQCVDAASRCNGTVECEDGSDEINCTCKRGEFRCRDGSCINISKRCNGHVDCRNGEDERNCGQPACPAEMFTCDPTSRVQCATQCDGRQECDAGEDEEDCDECPYKCDGRCLNSSQICDRVSDCSDSSDELNCGDCDSRNDFRCQNGECINDILRCNGVPECQDGSDELHCDVITPSPDHCNENQYQCRDGSCINGIFVCDGRQDCNDNSDEENCPWFGTRPPRSPNESPTCHESEFTCYNGRCIPHLLRCDNVYDCSDFSDEQNCYNSACQEGEWQCISGQCISDSAYCNGFPDCMDQSDERDCPLPERPFTTTSFPLLPPPTQGVVGVCDKNEWRCENGPCIDVRKRCDGHLDCPSDSSDEFDCPPGSPVSLKLRTYPDEQTVRNGGDVVFVCRDEGPYRAPVRWVREGGRPLKPGYVDRRGRLELEGVSTADSGVYICQASGYLGQPGSEAKVYLKVEEPISTWRPFSCRPDQATCSNGQCISRANVCDGRRDCSDGSDEDSCTENGKCEPNQYQCTNRKCVLKTWLCDNQDDCGDGSDEENCAVTHERPGHCLAVEFSCSSQDQCIPRGFHCDGQSDCNDGSDEIGCAPVHVTRPPRPAYVRLNPGDVLTLVCEAVGVPTPLISWRLNWGHVPVKCTATSENGIGTLTCPNMQPEDSGAYSCEAMNNKATTFATPDSIVYVNKTDPCPAGYFNSEARSQDECIRCFCFGESTQCRSADLFTYNMPTPLGEGGTMLYGIKQSYNGDVQIDKQSITNQYYYTPLRNGATVTLAYNSGWPRSNNIHPYLTLPETYNGNQLTSYGGHIKYRLSPHSKLYVPDNSVPDIIIKGKYKTLVHFHRGESARQISIEARLTPGYWQTTNPSGLSRASREDIMMALDNIEMILLRVDQNNGGVNITDFVMESAQHINVGLGAASLVEECTCPPGYEGLSCQKCAAGYVRERSGPWLGNCVKKQECPPGTYSDPNNELDCKPCPCPLTNNRNQFARTCAVGPAGNIICDCFPGYEGEDCSRCAPTHLGNPLIPGDYCKPKPSNNCDPLGTVLVRSPDECVCKDNVQGRYCDQCKNGSFYLSSDFSHGCALCFCTGMTQECTSSSYRRKTTTMHFNVPNLVDQLKVFQSTPFSSAGAVRYYAPIESEIKPLFSRGEVALTSLERSSQPTIYYWSLPVNFAGDKITSYGGYLRYALRHIPTPGQNTRNTAADVQLISDNRLTFHYFGNFAPGNDGFLNASVQFLEKGWKRHDGKEVSREHFLLALADVKTILVKATYTSNTEVATLVSASIDTAEPNGDGPIALHVEQCICPQGHIGTSCEDCAPGYTRTSSGLYLAHCKPCNCSGHSSMCHPETGVCYDCADNTAGESCEECREGYERDEYYNCVPSSAITPPTDCNCDPRGEVAPCSGECHCKLNVEGTYCDRCRQGTFGLDSSNPLGCTSCFCNGVTTTCHEASHYARIPMAAPIFGERHGGYTLMDLRAEQVISEDFIPVPNQSELMYSFKFPPQEELYWSLPVFPGNRVLSYGGTLSLKQEFHSKDDSAESRPGQDIVLVGDTISLYWSNPNIIRSSVALSYQVPLTETDWYVLNTGAPASRSNFMSVLKNLRRVLVRATLAPNLSLSSIADVSMDTATETYDTTLPVATGVEVCMCPEGYSGTSCELCSAGFYEDRNGRCSRCNCNGHDCQLGPSDEVICNCRPPYTGPDCSSIGLVMELHPTIHEPVFANSTVVRVTFKCKYRAPEPLTIKFYFEGLEMRPPKYYNDSKHYVDGWRGEHMWHTLWDTKNQGQIYECRTITETGFTLGVLTTTLPEKGNEISTTTRPPPPHSTVDVRITSNNLMIMEVGSSVNFTCQARSPMTASRLNVTWYKENGYLPQDRTQIDQRKGLLLITNLQVSDSGVYICQTSDGISTEQARATLKVPGNDMTLPTVSITPAMKDYYEGENIELICNTSGNPAPTVTWQRGSNQPLPYSAVAYDALLRIDNARVEDSGEYRCIARNSAGRTDRTAIVTVRPRPSQPSREKLVVNPTAPNVYEGQNTRVVCTGTTNVPPGTIQWLRQDGAEFLPNVRDDNGVLYIDSAVFENQGVYVCRSLSYEINPVQIVITVVSQNTPSPIAPEITVSTERLTIPTGDSGTVDCEVNGYPRPLVRWTKHQGQFGPGTSQRGNTLIITNAQESDQGYYNCEGFIDGRPSVSKYVLVEIERREPPRVQIWPTEARHLVTLGTQYDLHCMVQGGIPEPYVTWDRHGGRALSPHVQMQKQNVLRFERVEVNDEGEYTCTASNAAGTASASAVIKVVSMPEITITPSEYIVLPVGDPITIQCRAQGYPDPEVSIKDFRDLEIVSPTPRIAELRIASVHYEDEGEYVCTARSEAGSIEERFVISVDRGDGGDDTNGDINPEPDQDEGSGEPNINIDEDSPYGALPGSNLAIEGKETRLICNATNEYEVRWTRGDRRNLQYNARQIGNDLVIYNTTKRDSGLYVCTFVNPYTGEAKRTAIYTNLEVIAPPRISLRPVQQVAQPGQSPTVECVVEGDDVVVSWTLPNRVPSNRIEIHGSTLRFRQIQIEDAGEYICFARNRIANATATAKVIVSEDSNRTTWESHDNEQFAHVGSAVHLSCNVTQPDHRIHWTKDGRGLPRSVNRKRDGSLFIRLAQKSDSGRYVCVISDSYGRKSSNYINLHIEGVKCLDEQFQCTDGNGCVDDFFLCDGNEDCLDGSDEANCIWRDKRLSGSLSDLYFNLAGAPEEALALVSIDQPRRQFRIGEKVEVLCRSKSKGTRVKWERYGTQEFVDTTVYGDGALLRIPGVEESDTGVYRCTGRDAYGRTSYDDFRLEVMPGSSGPSYPQTEKDQVFKARLHDTVDLPCTHNLEEPVTFEWRREYSQLPSDVRPNENYLHLERVTEKDAGTYVCRVSNSRTAVETRAVLRVTGVIPRFDGSSYIALPTLKDAYERFDIEISFKPTDNNGLLLYNSQYRDNSQRNGDFLALQLVNGVPRFTLDTGNGAVVINGDRPLTLNTWHTIRLSRIDVKVSMDVDNNGPFTDESMARDHIIELQEPLYVGGVPDYRELPYQIVNATGFVGCVSMLILGREDQNIMVSNEEVYNVQECDTCTPHQCLNNGVCQEARNERGYVCHCAPGFAGRNCDRTGEACRPGLCGPGRCIDAPDGYKCHCPIPYTGKKCDVKQSIEYPAFTGSAFLAVKPPDTSRFIGISMKVKPSAPVADGIIMYCAQSPRGFGGFISLVVRNGKLEFRYDFGDGSKPVVLTSNKTLVPNDWTDVRMTRLNVDVLMKIDLVNEYKGTLESPKDLTFATPLFVGGVDDSIMLNSNTGVAGGFSGCIKDVILNSVSLDLVNSTIQSANVQECINYDRGDIPELDGVCTQCRNGGYCASLDATSCTCPAGFSGAYCENRSYRDSRPAYRDNQRPREDPCALRPCRNQGVCKIDRSRGLNYSCDCPLGFTGANCHINERLGESVGFNGNGYLTLPPNHINYDNLETSPALVALAFVATSDGVLFYQREARVSPDDQSDFVLLRIDRGVVVLEWNLGSGIANVSIDNIIVTDGYRHEVVAKLFYDNHVELDVDREVKREMSIGISNIMNADSNIYIGGIPDNLNYINRYPGLTGCIQQIEFMDMNRALHLGDNAIDGKNVQRCKNALHLDVYPYFDDLEVFESPPPRYFLNSSPKARKSYACLTLLPSLLFLVDT